MEIRPVGAEFFQAGEQRHMTKLIVAFRSFADAPNKSTYTMGKRIAFNASNFPSYQEPASPRSLITVAVNLIQFVIVT